MVLTASAGCPDEWEVVFVFVAVLVAVALVVVVGAPLLAAVAGGAVMEEACFPWKESRSQASRLVG